MIRTQIQLTEEQVTKLKRLARERGVSMAAIIREAVDRGLHLEDAASRRERAIAAVQRGGFRSDRKDVSVDHDRHLAEAYAE